MGVDIGTCSAIQDTFYFFCGPQFDVNFVDVVEVFQKFGVILLQCIEETNRYTHSSKLQEVFHSSSFIPGTDITVDEVF